MTYQPGDILLDKYRIEELIGRGAFAEVYRATHLELDRPRALKILRKDSKEVGSSTYHDYEQRFGLEAKLGDRLDHPNLIQVYDFDREGDDLVLVMGYAPGGNLAEKIQTARDHGEVIPIEEIKRIALDIAQGLAEIHELDIVHRDLKPSNIVFDKDGRAKIADLGLAQTPESRMARELTGSIGFDQPGTLEYMPPEQRPGNKMPVKASADIYALGCVIFEMLTRRVYYQQRTGTKPRSLRSDVPPWIDKLVIKMLSDDPNNRPWDGNEAIKALKNEIELFRWRWLIGIAVIGITLAILFFIWRKSITPVTTAETPTVPPTINETIAHTLIETPVLGVTISPTRTETISATPTQTGTSKPSATITPTRTDTTTASPTNTHTPEPTVTPMPTLGVGSILNSEVDGMVQVYIPAGEFEMGWFAHKVYLDAFWIDQTEVNHAMYNKCVEDGACEQSSSPRYDDLDFADHPVIIVNWYDANDYCEWAGRRLPTEAEWEKAARGGLEGALYPWGNEDPVCTPGAVNGAQWMDCSWSTVSVGTFAPNGYGIFDVIGNVKEWVADWYEKDYLDEMPYENPTGPASGESRVLRGDSWAHTPLSKIAQRQSSSPTYENYDVGFRCAMDADQ